MSPNDTSKELKSLSNKVNKNSNKSKSGQLKKKKLLSKKSDNK